MNFNAVWSPSGQEVIFSHSERGVSRPVRRGPTPLLLLDGLVAIMENR